MIHWKQFYLRHGRTINVNTSLNNHSLLYFEGLASARFNSCITQTSQSSLVWSSLLYIL